MLSNVDLDYIHIFLCTGHVSNNTFYNPYYRYDQDGNEEVPNFPYKIALKPTGEVNFRDEPSNNLDFLQQFIDLIPDGTTLYTFITYSDPKDVYGTEMGKLVVVDGCYPTKFGDEELFFRHQRLEEDIELRPEWENDYALIPY